MVGRRERADPCECAYVVAHNLLRWTQLIGPPDTTVRAARTLRRRLITIAGRLTRHGRSWTLYLPAHWPWHGDRAEHRPGAVGVELPGGGMRQRFLRHHAYRTVGEFLSGGAVGPESSSVKLLMAEAEQRLATTAIELLGPSLQHADPRARVEDAFWEETYLYSRAASVYGGTREIQRNIIADRILRLPQR